MKDQCFILLSTATKVDEVIKVSNYEEARKLASNKKYWKFRIFYIEGQSIKVGDFVPNVEWSGGAVLLRNKKTKERRFSKKAFRDDRKKRDLHGALFSHYYKNLKSDKLNRIRDKIKFCDPTQDEDIIYRVFYNSFKMYKARDKILDLAKLFVELVGETPKDNHYELVLQMEKLDFSPVLIGLIKSCLSVIWYMDRNDESAWIQDAQKLFSANFLAYHGLLFLIEFSEDILNKKGILFDDARILSSMQAAAMEIWNPLIGIRYSSDYMKEFRKTLNPKN